MNIKLINRRKDTRGQDISQQEAFANMLSQADDILLAVCVFFTSREGGDMRDLYQEIVYNLWEAWPSFRHECSYRTWVYRIALNVVGQEVRRSRKRITFLPIGRVIADIAADEDDDYRYITLYRLIDRLDSDDRKLIFLYLDHVPIGEIALIIGITEAAVKQRIYRIKEKLKTLRKYDDE